jgi:aminomethyltransferase
MSRTLKAAEPGASIELIDGAEVVWQVDSYEDEYRAVREGAALSDLSGAGPLRVAGSDAAAALNAVLTRDVELLVPEQTQASLVLAPDGRPLDAVVVLALAPDEYLVTCGPGRGPTVSEAVRAASPGAEAEIEDLAESMAVFSARDRNPGARWTRCSARTSSGWPTAACCRGRSTARRSWSPGSG